MEVKGKTALITGGATGIGKSCALMLAELGTNVAINYSRTNAEAMGTVRELEAKGIKARAFRADVASDRDVRKMVQEVINEFGRIDVLVNSAGRTYYIEMDDLEGIQEEHWDELLNVNVKGAFWVTRACAPELKKNQGCVVNISSIAGFMGRGSSLPYAVSKAAVINLTKCLARSLSPSVRVNSVAPGIVNTRWVAGQNEHIRRQSDGTLLGRIAEPQDIAEAVLALVLQGDFNTGQTLIVDGGFNL
jgi:3-oxoacyl-[acyl-carrier protein] reductase